jgi:hypothetical protein
MKAELYSCYSKILKPIAVAIVSVGLCTAVAHSQPKAKRHAVKPKQSGNEVMLTVSGKTRAYIELHPMQPCVVDVEGPGELRALTRAVLPSPTAEGGSYGILCTIDGKAQQSFDVDEVEPSQNAKFLDGRDGVPGDAETLTIQIDRGRHSVELRVRNAEPVVIARLQFTPHRQLKRKWIAMTPLGPVEPVDLVAGDVVVHCYRFSKEKPLRLDIVGPTDLRILTRVENSFSMKGRSNYRLQIRQDGDVAQSFQLSSRRSETISYKSSPTLIPGKVREIRFAVPKGKHRIEIAALDNHALLGQILFPQKDTKLGL